jgi:hypothetical protein
VALRPVAPLTGFPYRQDSLRRGPSGMDLVSFLDIARPIRAALDEVGNDEVAHSGRPP